LKDIFGSIVNKYFFNKQNLKIKNVSHG